MILLRFDEIETPRKSIDKLSRSALTLRNPVILAQGFDLRTGRTQITVPDLLSGTNYSIVLFGDSGNWS
jgi:hypothetical protein